MREKIENSRATDVVIEVAGGVPPPNDKPSPEKEQLYVALSSAATVIKTVCQRMKDRADSWFKRNFFPARIESEKRRAETLLDQYMRKLAGIGRVGLEGPHTSLGSLALEGLRQEFVSQEAGRIKNAYIRSLGLFAASTAIPFLIVYVLIAADSIRSPWWQQHKTFLLAMVGAAVGAWLSFSIRRVKLSFDDLAILEEDLLDPSVRVIFCNGSHLGRLLALLDWRDKH